MKKNISIYFESDRYINDVLINKEYDFLFKDLVVIDIGANIGTFSFYIYNKAEKIYAIEPAIENLVSLRETVKKNRLDKIKIFELAICGSEKGLFLRKKGGPQSGADRLTRDGTVSVKCKTLTEFMDDEEIDYVDLVKIDVEGLEHDIFLSDDFKKGSRKINTIIGEMHPGYNLNAFRENLDSLNFKLKIYRPNHFVARKI